MEKRSSIGQFPDLSQLQLQQQQQSQPLPSNSNPNSNSNSNPHWTRSSAARRNTFAAPLSLPYPVPLTPLPLPIPRSSSLLIVPQFTSPFLEYLPLPLLTQSSPAAFQQQLEGYNRLLLSGSGVKNTLVPSSTPLSAQQQLQTPILTQPSIVPFQPVSRQAPSAHSTPRGARTASRGNGNKKSPNSRQGDRGFMTTPDKADTDTAADMADRTFQMQQQLPTRPAALQQHHALQQNLASTVQQSSSVPSTPHQRARKYSLNDDSREPSPIPSHSPRSAYSETGPSQPSIRPLPLPSNHHCPFETAMQYARRRMAYSIGTDPLEPEENVKLELSDSEDRQIEAKMRELYDRLLPTPGGEENRIKFVNKLERMLNTEWPSHDIKVHMFGSSGNMLWTDDSDVDICITTPWKELEKVCKLAELLHRNGMQKVVCISQAKVPIVKIWDPELKLACDMNVNNTLALENTRMLRTYVDIDERVRPLAIIIKHWTKKRVVNNAGKSHAYGATLSSYTWICMVINFLQTRKPPILPSLHQRPHQKLPGHTSSSFADDVERLRGFGEDNKESLAQLLFHFFRFYAHEMNYDKHVISVRAGTLLTKIEKGWHLGSNNMLCVEEPFNTARNLANTADDTSFRGLHIELRRAFSFIARGELEACCEQYIFPEQEEKSIFQRPAQQSRPIISRTPSGTITNRGGRRGGTGGFRPQGSKTNGTGVGSRRVSAGAYDNPNIAQQPYVAVPPAYPGTAAEWVAAQKQMHTDLNTQLHHLKTQESNLRNMLYQQSQQYTHMHTQAQYQVEQTARAAGNERSRGHSFANHPANLQLFYPMGHQPIIYGGPNATTYPTSPSVPPSGPDLRYVNGRITTTSGAPIMVNSSGSALRSHSQPASRPLPPQIPVMHTVPVATHAYLLQGYNQPGSENAVPVMLSHSDIGDGYDRHWVPTSTSPPNNVNPKEYLGYYMWQPQSNSSEQISQSKVLPHHSTAQPQSSGFRRRSLVIPPIPPFNESARANRRPSADQFPHAIMDRVRRGSRSPSPLRDHPDGGLVANSTTNSTEALTSSHQFRQERGPVMANGSINNTYQQPGSSSGQSSSRAPTSDTSQEAFPLYGISSEPGHSAFQMTSNAGDRRYTTGETQHNVARLPTVFQNESSLSGLGISEDLGPLALPPPSASCDKHIPQKNTDPLSKPQANGVGHLHIGALPAADLTRGDVAHLSPVYEIRSPSPKLSRKNSEYSKTKKLPSNTTSAPGPSKLLQVQTDAPPPSQTTKQDVIARKLALANSQKPAVAPASKTPNGVNGHRPSQSEASDGGWTQQRTKSKKKTHTNGNSKGQQAVNSTEKKPSQDTERKGG